MAPEQFRTLGHRVVDQIADFLGDLRERPVAPSMTPEQVLEELGNAAMPESGLEPEQILDRSIELLGRYNRLTMHPRQWGYIIGSASPIGALADLIAASFNPNVVSWQGAPMATEIENQAVRWIGELLGYPVGGGLMVSGGNMANFIGFFAARRRQADWELRRAGLNGNGARRLTAYVSAETHTWIEKAADLSGMGTDAIRWIPTDENLRMRTDALTRQIEADRADGALPFLIVGTAGTVSTGAVDPLPELAEIARRFQLWFHVDGAYGAPAILADDSPADLQGLREADSVAVDAHKWLYVPLEAGCALVRERRHLVDTFAYHPRYYDGLKAAGVDLVNFHEMGMQNSRGMRALKVWLVLQQVGRRELVRLIEGDMSLARALFKILDAAPDFEAVTRNLSIATFRYVPEDLRDAGNDEYLDTLNSKLMIAVQRSGKAYLSNAVIDGRYLLRTCITNFRAGLEDVKALPDIIRELAVPLDAELRDRHPS
jgi:glutamate/tyrosine decarboxylase-like PLP-dependent enzyme